MLVTGGTRGIGAAISRSLAGRGAVVAAGFSSDATRAAEFVRTLGPDGPEASVHQGNAGDCDDCLRVVQEVIDQHGRLDVLVNNADVTVDRPGLDDERGRLAQRAIEDAELVLGGEPPPRRLRRGVVVSHAAIMGAREPGCRGHGHGST